MKMYFSGTFSPNRDVDIVQKMVDLHCCRLFTYAYPEQVFKYLEAVERLGGSADIMMDSGAFTAWNIGRPVQLEALIEYNRKVLDIYGDRHEFTFIALDVIPGERGRRATEAEILHGMEESYANFCTMQEALPRPVLPVYHSSEPIEFRDRFLERTDHICLSMSQDLSEKHRVTWARMASQGCGKLHGLAATGNSIIRHVDWYSVDSAGWLMVGAMGSILWPTPTGLKPFSVSSDSPARKNAEGHFDNRSDKEYIEEVIKARGYDPEELRVSYVQRWMWNIDMWMTYEWPRERVELQGLFNL